MRLLLAAIVLACGLVFASGAVAGSGSSAAAIPDQYIVVLNDDANVQAAALSASRLGADVLARYDHALNGFAVRASAAALAAITANPQVRFISPNLELTLASQALPTGVDRIDGELSSTVSGDGSGSVPINVAVVDTGIDLTHPDLNVVGGRNCASDRAPSFDDHYGHGTHVAGIIGAKDNDEGVVGVAPGARLWACASGVGSARARLRLRCAGSTS
jgi:subtilisin